jgi:hypothetical protein
MNKNDYLEKLGNIAKSYKDTGMKSGLTLGQRLALRNYDDCIRHNSSDFEITELPPESILEDFMNTILLADIHSMVITAKDTSVIEFLHLIQRRGWHIQGLEKIDRKDTGCFGVYDYDVPGIRVKIG